MPRKKRGGEKNEGHNSQTSFENNDTFYVGGSRRMTNSKSPPRRQVQKPDLINEFEPKGGLFSVGGLFQKMQDQ